ncbi:LysR family transcriptional regulator [Rouxiella silvae]|uniref:LysR family transcriptional regulator n=1 Tax=Rouxiella silvae TaxID=1646373 RepID=A0AA40X433_9GAMM|nr:LysR family transcriptional regulator [Rouxiella silvae]KQN48354.1 LysR family transcriptional regulator [Serratia sp. Leaf50]MBF6638317.1 LysR family transcriptional regulator [Rouxiella silvae]ORJ21941.1 LysR family transcriptional regulator [Rouxiella silvae]
MLQHRLLMYLDQVARAGSIRKAAARLHISASAINRQILALEDELGTPLFQRLPRKMVLTAAGEVLIHHVRQSFKELEWAQVKIEELKGLRRGEVTVAMMSGLAANLIPRMASEFRRANPRVKLILRQLTNGDEIMAAVESGEADLGIGFDFDLPPTLRVLSSVTGRLGAVVAPGHPLADKTSLRISDCIAYPIIIADKSTVIRPYLNDVFAKALVSAHPVIETNSIEVMRHAAMVDQGLTFLTPFDIEFDQRAGRLIYIPVRELGQQTQQLMLIGHDRGTSAIGSVLAETVKGMMSETG